MLKQIKIYSLALMLLTLSCKSRKDQAEVKKPGSGTTASTEMESARKLEEKKAAILTMPSHRLVVSFISIGAGISTEAKEKLADYIAGAEKKYGVTIARVNGYWGREGETDVLFPLTELNAGQQQEFINGLKELFKDNKLIIIEENREARTYKQ